MLTLRRRSRQSVHTLDSLGCEDRARQRFADTVHYRGNVVARKAVRPAPLTRSLMLELTKLKDLQHMNLARFVGACLEPGRSISRDTVSQQIIRSSCPHTNTKVQ